MSNTIQKMHPALSKNEGQRTLDLEIKTRPTPSWRSSSNEAPEFRVTPVKMVSIEKIVWTKTNNIVITLSSSSSSVEDKIKKLPPDLQAEAIHYIDELVKRSENKSPAPFRCVAEGALAELGTRYSSVDLQHKASEWRGT